MTDTNEQHNHSHKTKKKSNEWIKLVAVLAIVVLACGVSFVAGVQYQKRQKPSFASQNGFDGFGQGNGMGGGYRGGGMRQNGVIGSVTAISATSITVNNTRTGSASTKTINDSTVITNNGTKVTADSIKAGDNVLIRTSSSDTNTATAIDVNPTMPIGRMQSSASPSDASNFDIQTN